MLESPFFSTWFGMAVLLLALVLALLWCFLPLAVFGIKDKLTSVIDELRNNTEHLKVVIEEARALRKLSDEGIE